MAGTILEECESSKGGVLAGTWNGENGGVGVEGYFKFVLSAMGAAPILGLSFGGDEKRLLDLFFVIEEAWYLEDGVSASKPKGKMELEILECSIILLLEAMALVDAKVGLEPVLWV